MLGPTPIELNPLFVGQFEGALTVRIRKAFPKGDGEFHAIPRRELKELGKWAGCHALIVSRVDVASQYPRDSRRPRRPRNSCDFVSTFVQRSNAMRLTRGGRFLSASSQLARRVAADGSSRC